MVIVTTFKDLANIMRERGKCKTVLMNYRGQCCLLGVVLLAEDPEFDADKAADEGNYAKLNKNPLVMQMADVLDPNNIYDNPSQPVYNFSDHSSEEDVIAFLESM